MSTPALYTEPIHPQSVRDQRARLGLCHNKNREERAWYKRLLWLPSYIWTPSTKPLESNPRSIIPTKLSQSKPPNLDGQNLEDKIINSNTRPGQLPDWTVVARQSDVAKDDRGNVELMSPQIPSNLVVEKEKKQSGNAYPHGMTSEFDEPPDKDEVEPPDIQHSSPIPSKSIVIDQHNPHRSASDLGRGVTFDLPDLQHQSAGITGNDLRSIPSSLLSDTPSGPSSESYQYAADKINLEPVELDDLNREEMNKFDVLGSTNYSGTSAREPTSTPLEHAHTRDSSATPLSNQNIKTILLPEYTPFFSPEPCALSESSQGPTVTLKSSDSSMSAFAEPRPLRQLQAGSALQTGSTLSPAINTLVDEAMIRYDSYPLDDFATLTDMYSESDSPSPMRLTQELEDRFTALVNIRDALLLRQLAVTTDIGSVLELLLPKMRLYIKDEATLTRIYDEIRSIRQACLDHELNINFHALEHISSFVSTHTPSIQQRVEALQRELQPFFDRNQDSRDAALRFLVDPRALRENRLGVFSMSQR